MFPLPPVPSKLCLVGKTPHWQNPQGLTTLKSQQNLEGLTKLKPQQNPQGLTPQKLCILHFFLQKLFIYQMQSHCKTLKV
jgi:hypothetical protein